MDWPGGGSGVVVNGATNGTINNIQAQTVYSFQACIDACVIYNHNIGYTACLAVTYNANLTEDFVTNNRGGDCWLKDRQGVDVAQGNETASGALLLPCDV